MIYRQTIVLAALIALSAGGFLLRKDASETSGITKTPSQVGGTSKSPRSEIERFELNRRKQAQRIRAAEELWKNGNRADAEREIVALSGSSPLFAHTTLARLYENAGSPAKAYVHWKRVLLSSDIGVDGTEAPGLALRVAKLAQSYGTPQEALALLRKAAGKPRSPDSKNIYDPGLDFDYNDPLQLEAAAHVRVARSLDPWSASNAVVDEFIRAIALQPNRGDAYYWLGTNLPTSGRHREAVEVLKRATQLGSPAVRRAAESLLNNELYFAEQQTKGKMKDKMPQDGSSVLQRLPVLIRP